MSVLAFFCMLTQTSVCLYANVPPTDANINGHVIDGDTGEHIPFCTIKILGTSIVALTDASGHYALHDINPGKYEIEASYVVIRPKQNGLRSLRGKRWK